MTSRFFPSDQLFSSSKNAFVAAAAIAHSSRLVSHPKAMPLNAPISMPCKSLKLNSRFLPLASRKFSLNPVFRAVFLCDENSNRIKVIVGGKFAKVFPFFITDTILTSPLKYRVIK